MYFYVAFFSEDALSGQKFYLSGKNMESFKQVFPNFRELSQTEIEECIGFFKGKDYADKKCFILKVRDLKVNDDFLSFGFDVDRELDITSEFISKSLYKFARQSDWINEENKYCPILCMLEKEDFDTIRKGTPNIKKQSNILAEIDELKGKNNWVGICNLFEPLEELSEREDVWNNEYTLYQIAFACSKQGELKNGMGKDTQHLAKIKRYRELSIAFFKRCCELKPDASRYPSAIAYRYYRNVRELSGRGGRRDGNVADEISQAITWLDKALQINPESIKDNYRKGKLILDKQETYSQLKDMEQSAIECLGKVIDQYKNLSSEGKSYYRNEFVKALYTLGCYYSEKPRIMWNKYACCKMKQVKFNFNITREEMDYLVRARDLFERCYAAELPDGFESTSHDYQDYERLLKASKDWAVSLMDKLYRLGLVYLKMYFIKQVKSDNIEKINEYSQKAEEYLAAARSVGDISKKKNISRRSTWYISEKLAWYYILRGDYDKAIHLIERARDGYIRNTYAIALMLSDLPDRFQKAEEVLKAAISDPNNSAQNTSLTLRKYLYELCGKNGE